MQEVSRVIAAARLLPVVVIDDERAALPLAAALKEGGLRCVEIALRTPAAHSALRAMAGDPELTVGAGTVLNLNQLDSALEAGAQYIVTPGFSPRIVQRCQSLSVPVFPGVATATDLHMAVDAGLDAVKFFPAELLGGPAMLNALTGPFPAMKFIPTGGINAANLAAYLCQSAVMAVGGSWMVERQLLRTGAFVQVAKLTAEAVALAGAVA